MNITRNVSKHISRNIFHLNAHTTLEPRFTISSGTSPSGFAYHGKAIRPKGNRADLLPHSPRTKSPREEHLR